MSELLKINVNEHTEKKNGLTYLSWAWAWAEALKADPAALWWAHDYTGADGQTVPYMLVNGTAMVKTTVRIKDVERECLLPVMDHRNKAIKDPDAFAVNTAIMRCMTKALSMHGLGLYIYAGEDWPEETETERLLKLSIERAKEKRRSELDESLIDIINLFNAGEKTQVLKLWFEEPRFYKNGEELEYCWNALSTETAIRTMLHANNPHREHNEKPKVTRLAPGPGLKKIGVRATTEETT
jgi:hypothetical protein